MKPGKGRVILSLVLFAAIVTAIPFRRPQAQIPKKQFKIKPEQIQTVESYEEQTPGASAAADGYVIVKTDKGSECRQVSRNEAQQMRLAERRVELHTIPDTSPRVARQGFTITLRGTQQLENFPVAKQAFQRAAAKWQAIIQDPVTTTIDVDYGTTRFGTPYSSPNIIGATSDPILFLRDQYEPFRSFLLSNADGPGQSIGYGTLPTGSLATDLGSTTNVRLTTTQLLALGQSNLPGNAAIGFNSAIPFDFDPSDGIDADKVDFEAAAVHEIGHALGFVSSVGFKELVPTVSNIPSIWDFFRLRPGGLTLGTAAAQMRIQTIGGGLQNYFSGLDEFEFSTGGQDGTGGDQRQASHWRDDTVTGRFIGIMDPTATDGQPDYITAADLAALNLLIYTINPDATVYELPSVDDNTQEESIALANGIVVNRFTPSRYPSTLQGLRLRVPSAVMAGQSIRVVAFVDANRTGQPPANPAFIADRTLNLPAIPPSRYLDISLSNVPAITSGDLYLGIQSTNTLIGADSNGFQRRASFLSTNNGASFAPLQNSANAPVNFMARAILSNKFSAAVIPAPSVISPSAVAPGLGEFTMVVQGTGFRQGSVVRFNNTDRPTTFVSGNELRAQIPAADVASAGTARITIFTANAGDSGAINFVITGDNPAPAIARLSPASVVAGAAATNLNVFGTNFTAQSVIRLNGNALSTTRTGSVQLTAQLPANALAAAGDAKISVFTPGPGGGTTTELNLSVVSCSYTLSSQSLTITSSGNTATSVPGFVLNTNGVCNWNVAADQPWLTITNPAGGTGTGKFVINFNVAPNTTAALRTGNVTVGGQTFAVRQVGRATGVSAASFVATGGLAPDSISALFGAGLAKETVVATTQPLPTTLGGTRVFVVNSAGTGTPAPLFFVSPGQINFLIPTGLTAGTYTILVQVDGASIADGPATIAAVSPGLFAQNANGQGVAAAVALRVKVDGTQLFEPISRFDQAQNKFVSIPIDLGPEGEKVFAILYGSGVRGRTGLPGITLRIGDATSTVSFAGPVTGLTGLDQLNAEIPRSLIGKGEVTLNLMVDGKPANAVTLNTK